MSLFAPLFKNLSICKFTLYVKSDSQAINRNKKQLANLEMPKCLDLIKKLQKKNSNMQHLNLASYLLMKIIKIPEINQKYSELKAKIKVIIVLFIINSYTYRFNC